jgi:hypothetical protein
MLKPFIVGMLIVASSGPGIPANRHSNDSPAHSDDSIEYVRQVRDFINRAQIETLRDSINILGDIPTTLAGSNEYCLHDLNEDSTHITKAELEYIQVQAKKIKIKVWPADISWRIKVIREDTIKQIFNNRKMGWDYFYKNIGRSINRFSLPIFFGDKYCLFYSGNTCGGKCGNASWKLYRKDGDFWFVVRSYCEWVS